MITIMTTSNAPAPLLRAPARRLRWPVRKRATAAALPPHVELCAHLCQRAYQRGTPLPEGAAGLTVVREVDRNRAQAVVAVQRAEGRSVVYVAFRGTDEARDFLRDACVVKRPFRVRGIDMGRVHMGFHDYYRALRMECVHAIQGELRAGDAASLVFCGHSLGGCVGFLAMHAKLLWPDLHVACVTFGSPRLGDARFTSCMEALLDCNLRVINARDPIPHFPVLGYRHGGRAVLFDKDGRLVRRRGRITNCLALLSICLASLISMFRVSPFEHHAMSKYVDHLVVVGGRAPQ